MLFRATLKKLTNSLIAKHIYNAVRITVIPCRNLNAASSAGCMNDLSVADIHCHMIDRAAPIGIEDQVTRAHLGRLNLGSLLCLGSGHTLQIHAGHMLIDITDKTRAVRTGMRITN